MQTTDTTCPRGEDTGEPCPGVWTFQVAGACYELVARTCDHRAGAVQALLAAYDATHQTAPD